MDTSRSVVSESRGDAADDTPPIRRVLVVQAEGRTDAKRARQRAEWEAARRAGQATSLGVTVQGWRQGDGALWAPNLIAPVVAPVLGVDAELLIVSVAYSLDGSGGQITEMELAPAGGFELLAPAKRAAAGKAPVGDGIATWDDLQGAASDALSVVAGGLF